MIYIDNAYSAIAKKDIKVKSLENKFVASGWPAASDDYADRQMNLHDYLIDQPAATYFMRIGSQDYEQDGIMKNDLLIVDRSITALSGKLVVAIIDGNMTIRRVSKADGRLYFAGDVPMPISAQGGTDASVWGVIAHIVRSF